MSLIKYKALVTAIDTNSLTKASEILGYTQPGISHMIASLEKEFGFQLLIRKKEGVVATDAAKELLYYLRQIISNEEKLKDTINKVNGVEIGSIRIGSYYSISVNWLPLIIKNFESRYPNISLQLFESDLKELLTMLEENRIDIGFISSPPPEGFDFITLKQDPILAVMQTTHPLAQEETIDPLSLSDELFIAPYEGSDEDILLVLDDNHIKPKIKYRVRGDDSIIFMVEQGLGISLMPELLLKRLPEGVVAKKLTREYYRTLGVAVRSIKYASPAIREFIKTVEDKLLCPLQPVNNHSHTRRENN